MLRHLHALTLIITNHTEWIYASTIYFLAGWLAASITDIDRDYIRTLWELAVKVLPAEAEDEEESRVVDDVRAFLTSYIGQLAEGGAFNR